VLGSAEGSLDGDGGGAAPPPDGTGGTGQPPQQVVAGALLLPHTLSLPPLHEETSLEQQLLHLVDPDPVQSAPSASHFVVVGARLSDGDIDGWKLGASEGTEVGSGCR
jgi:hypothetical protein